METLRLGIDIGSTTAKIVVCNKVGAVLHSNYVRHNTRIQETLIKLLSETDNKFINSLFQVAFSGSAGMGIAETTGYLFVQEIIAAATLVEENFKSVKSLIDIGGEDSKLILFKESKIPDIRMNGNCAGGTGAYIDQMAALLNLSIDELNSLAWKSTVTYPIASRCGVFAKTDVQNLVSRKINTADIAASIFDAVAGQIINTLARGCSIETEILFCGGPLTYISYLRESFLKLLKINKQQIIIPKNAELFVAIGAAFSIEPNTKILKLPDLIKTIKTTQHICSNNNRLKRLFANKYEANDWQLKRHEIIIPKRKLKQGDTCFLGIDSGSTTTKIVIINSEKDMLFSYYKNNNGKPLETVVEGLKQFTEQHFMDISSLTVGKAAVTGYGEELIKAALRIDYGLVETVAHFIAAKHIEPNVSFILDIGGQDIKAIFVQNQTISNIEINESCSSGCGSFIEGFANTLGYSCTDFSNLALEAEAPYDLGTRCTVFMNSKVKQALREGATIPDLSAGLAYSVIKNCLNKILHIKSASNLGDNIVVQGGTFKNKAVFRSLEILSGKKIVVSDNPEMMGAYGAALYALDSSDSNGFKSMFVGFQHLDKIVEYKTKLSTCHGCSNHCQITTYTFAHKGKCFSGNKCEKIFTNNSKAVNHGENIFDYKRQILFDRKNNNDSLTETTIGIPRILNMYENYPFWHTLLSQCGYRVELSDESTNEIYKKGIGAIMSDNICFPAKLSHGHIVNLLEKKVDRIFYPFVIYEKNEFEKSDNCYNCPIVTGYSEVLKNTTFLKDSANIPFDSPVINFNNPDLLKKACWSYCKSLGVKKSSFSKAFAAALDEQQNYKILLKSKNNAILNDAICNNKLVVMLASRPYHTDKLIHQQVSQMLSDLGVNIINEDIISKKNNEDFDSFYSVSQWNYTNRILQSASWASKQKFAMGFIQLNSFGCGPDSFIIDEIRDLTKKSGLSYALIRIDEISSPGSIKLRLRSLVESLKLKTKNSQPEIQIAI
jgi:predicted CoA-substrate-specific enzyme activase